MREVIGENLVEFTTAGSMGVVNDTRYVRCYWPRLDEPVELFAEGSSGIEVQGPPTPRNVVFPAGTVALGLSVDDGNFRDGRRWRTSEILTDITRFFSRTIVEKDVEEMRDSSAQIEVEPGLTVDVTYQKPVMVRKPVEEFTELPDPRGVKT